MMAWKLPAVIVKDPATWMDDRPRRLRWTRQVDCGPLATGVGPVTVAHSLPLPRRCPSSDLSPPSLGVGGKGET